PKPIPIFGNLLSLSLKPRPLLELEWYKKYGKIYGLYYSAKPRLTVADPALIKQILVKDFNAFRNRSLSPGQDGLNMFRARDNSWKRVRAIVSPTFTSGKMRKMYALINHCYEDFLNTLDNNVSNGVNEVELKQLMGAYTMDVIASCAFATKLNSYADPNNPFLTNAFNFINASNRTGRLPLPSFIVNTNIYRRVVST
ncbi:unnamed protein product, partial [Oppiella nova]